MSSSCEYARERRSVCAPCCVDAAHKDQYVCTRFACMLRLGYDCIDSPACQGYTAMRPASPQLNSSASDLIINTYFPH
jgi:hypothetical protein